VAQEAIFIIPTMDYTLPSMSRSRLVMRSALLLSLLFVAGAGDAWAQATVGRVSGTIRDEAGKPVPGATITATNPEQAVTLTATSDVKGKFGILGLRRGIWVFAVAAPGYQKTSQAGEVQLGGQNPPLNIKLVKSPTPQPGPLSTLTSAEIQTRIDAAEAAAASGDLASAIATYRELLSKVPALTTGYFRVGALLEQKGDAAAALEAYQELVKLEPDNARATAAVARLTRIP
jgi:tetratricopeptide (TPR) repeat protein